MLGVILFQIFGIIRHTTFLLILTYAQDIYLTSISVIKMLGSRFITKKSVVKNYARNMPDIRRRFLKIFRMRSFCSNIELVYKIKLNYFCYNAMTMFRLNLSIKFKVLILTAVIIVLDLEHTRA